MMYDANNEDTMPSSQVERTEPASSADMEERQVTDDSAS